MADEPDPEHYSWELSDEEREQLLTTPAADRYRWCLQLVADWQEVWGLNNPDGWVLSSGPAGDAFPIWPHPDLAQLCARGEWEGSTPEAIPLDELLEELLPVLEQDGLRVVVFPDPEGEGVVVTPAELRADLQEEVALGE
jgi:hypothetical protein